MRSLVINLVKMKYALLDNEIEEQTEFVNDDGVTEYYPTGNTIKTYSEPKEFKASIQYGGNNTESVEYGIEIDKYSAIITVINQDLPINETSIIWIDSDVEYETLYGEQVILKQSADYEVVKVSPTLNQVKYVLKKIQK